MSFKRNAPLRVFILAYLAIQLGATEQETSLLRVLFQEDAPPFLYKIPLENGSFALRGHGLAATDWALKYAKLRYVSDTFPAYPFGAEFAKPKPENFTYDTIGTFKITDFDVLVTQYGLGVNSQKVGDFTTVKKLTLSMIVPYPEENVKLWSFVYPFTPLVWICMLLAAVVLEGCAKAINLLATSKEKFDNPFLFMVTVIIGQGGTCSSPKYNLRLLAATWALAALILSNVYLSLLVSFFSAPYRVPLVKSLEQVVSSGLSPIRFKDSFEEGFFMDSPPGSIQRQIYEKSLDSMVCTYENYTTTCVDWLVRKHYAAAFVVHAEGEYYFDNLTTRDHCRLTSIDLQDFPTFYKGTYVMPKGHPSFKNLFIGMLRLTEYGLTPMKMQENAYQKCSCCNWKQDRPSLTKLGLKDLAGIFGILGAGYCIALVVFLVEVLIARIRYHNRPLN